MNHLRLVFGIIGVATAAIAAMAQAPAAPAANAPQDPPVAAVIDHLAFTVANFDKEKTLAILKDWGLKHQGPDGGPRPDGDSYHVWDPFGYDLQICGNGMSAYGAD